MRPTVGCSGASATIEGGRIPSLAGTGAPASAATVDHNRYAVAMLSEGTRDKYYDYGRRTLTLMAQALMPAGVVAGSS